MVHDRIKMRAAWKILSPRMSQEEAGVWWLNSSYAQPLDHSSNTYFEAQLTTISSSLPLLRCSYIFVSIFLNSYRDNNFISVNMKKNSSAISNNVMYNESSDAHKEKEHILSDVKNICWKKGWMRCWMKDLNATITL